MSDSAVVGAWVSTLARWLLGGVLLAAGAMKLVDLGTAASAAQAYRLVPDDVAATVGSAAPFLLIGLGLLLAAGVFTRAAAAASTVLILAFLVLVAVTAARGLNVTCGCFGGGGEVAPGEAAYLVEAVRAGALLVLAGWLCVRPRSRLSFERGPVEEDPVAPPADRGTDPVGSSRAQR